MTDLNEKISLLCTTIANKVQNQGVKKLMNTIFISTLCSLYTNMFWPWETQPDYIVITSSVSEPHSERKNLNFVW